MTAPTRRGVRAQLREDGHRVLALAEFFLAREEAAAQGVEWVTLTELGIDVNDHGSCPGAVLYLDWGMRPIGACTTPYEHRDALMAFNARQALRAADAAEVVS